MTMDNSGATFFRFQCDVRIVTAYPTFAPQQPQSQTLSVTQQQQSSIITGHM